MKTLLALTISLITLNSFATEFPVKAITGDKTIYIYAAKNENGETKLLDSNKIARLSYSADSTYYNISYFNSRGIRINKTASTYEKKALLDLMINTVANSEDGCYLAVTIDGPSIGLGQELVIKSISSSCDVLALNNSEDNNA